MSDAFDLMSNTSTSSNDMFEFEDNYLAGLPMLVVATLIKYLDRNSSMILITTIGTKKARILARDPKFSRLILFGNFLNVSHDSIIEAYPYNKDEKEPKAVDSYQPFNIEPAKYPKSLYKSESQIVGKIQTKEWRDQSETLPFKPLINLTAEEFNYLYCDHQLPPPLKIKMSKNNYVDHEPLFDPLDSTSYRL